MLCSSGLHSIVVQLKVCYVSHKLCITNSLVDLYRFLTANSEKNNLIPYHAVPSIIAVNMILAGASGGLLAVIIAVWAQVPHVYLYSSIVMIILL